MSVTCDKYPNTNGDDTSKSVSCAVQEEFGTRHATTTSPDISSSAVEWPSFPWDGYDDDSSDQQQEWGYQRNILLEEFPASNDDGITVYYDIPWIRSLLNNLVSLEKDFAERVAKCKRRDDTRGAAIVPGYAESHVAAEIDPVIVDAQEKNETTKRIVEELLTRIA